MSRRERKQLFALATAVVVGALLVMSLFDGSGGQQAVRPQDLAGDATIADQRLSEDAEGHEIGHGGDGSEEALVRARRLARRFIVAFARYQRGPIDESTARRLHEFATPQRARYLLAQPPRRSGAGQARMRIVRLDLTGSMGGPLKAAALLAYGQGRRSLLELQLERVGGSWRVSGLTHPAVEPWPRPHRPGSRRTRSTHEQRQAAL